MQKKPAIDHLRLDGGVMCLDFVNTVPDRIHEADRDHLNNLDDLLYWARKAKIIDQPTFALLETAAHANERQARDFFADAKDLRALIYSVFRSISHQQRVKAADLETFNALTTRYLPRLSLALQKDHFVEQWNMDGDDFFQVTAPIVKSARDLLLSDKLGRIKECPSCGWLFLDTTKNGKRKWCSMDDCGSNAKALDYYYRKKQERSS